MESNDAGYGGSGDADWSEATRRRLVAVISRQKLKSGGAGEARAGQDETGHTPSAHGNVSGPSIASHSTGCRRSRGSQNDLASFDRGSTENASCYRRHLQSIALQVSEHP
jgi:hypothetical protein